MLVKEFVSEVLWTIMVVPLTLICYFVGGIKGLYITVEDCVMTIHNKPIDAIYKIPLYIVAIPLSILASIGGMILGVIPTIKKVLFEE